LTKRNRTKRTWDCGGGSHLDAGLSRLRFRGDKGYRVPTGAAYAYVSCPSYLLEILIWAVWGTCFDIDFGIIAVWLWLLPNIFARAESTHRWYRRTFKGQYPPGRKAMIPFIDVGSVTAGFLGSMEYM